MRITSLFWIHSLIFWVLTYFWIILLEWEGLYYEYAYSEIQSQCWAIFLKMVCGCLHQRFSLLCLLMLSFLELKVCYLFLNYYHEVSYNQLNFLDKRLMKEQLILLIDVTMEAKGVLRTVEKWKEGERMLGLFSVLYYFDLRVWWG